MNGVKVSITVAEETGLTPAQVLNRTRQESQAMAVTAIESDPVVRELIEGFDASLLQNSIRPIVES
jgi:DNA polymerase-3 subunit gamma/tau